MVASQLEGDVAVEFSWSLVRQLFVSVGNFQGFFVETEDPVEFSLQNSSWFCSPRVPRWLDSTGILDGGEKPKN